MCNAHGEWEDIDFSGCTMSFGSTPIVMMEINQNMINLNTSGVSNEVSLLLYLH